MSELENDSADRVPRVQVTNVQEVSHQLVAVLEDKSTQTEEEQELDVRELLDEPLFPELDEETFVNMGVDQGELPPWCSATMEPRTDAELSLIHI